MYDSLLCQKVKVLFSSFCFVNGLTPVSFCNWTKTVEVACATKCISENLLFFYFHQNLLHQTNHHLSYDCPTSYGRLTTLQVLITYLRRCTYLAAVQSTYYVSQFQGFSDPPSPPRHRGEREFPFPAIPGNTGLPFPFPKIGNDFFIPIPVPKSWECNFSFPFPFPKFGNTIFHSRSRYREWIIKVGNKNGNGVQKVVIRGL